MARGYAICITVSLPGPHLMNALIEGTAGADVRAAANRMRRIDVSWQRPVTFQRTK